MKSADNLCINLAHRQTEWQTNRADRINSALAVVTIAKNINEAADNFMTTGLTTDWLTKSSHWVTNPLPPRISHYFSASLETYR